LRETGEGATVFQSNGWYFQNTADPAVTAVHFTDAGAATFYGDVTIDDGTSSTLSIYKDNAGAGKISFYNDTTQQVYLLHDSSENFYIHGGTGTQLIFYSGGAESFKLDASQNATFTETVTTGGRVTIIPGYAGYDQIKIASNTTANTNKLSGIYTENYEGNNVSIFQTFTQDGNNTIYYGSADSNYAGMQNHRFYVNADSDTAGSGHTEALHIASNTNATFSGTIASGNISVTGGGGGNGQIDVLRTSGANVRIQSQSATGVLAVTTNHPLHLKTNDTTRVTIAAGGDAIFSGDVVIGHTAVVSSSTLTLNGNQSALAFSRDTGTDPTWTISSDSSKM